VEDVVGAYLAAVDAQAAGLVEGLYLVGSVALGDFRPHTSDIDFVAVTATPPDSAALAMLERAHAQVRKRWRQPFFDGCYLTWDDLAQGPAQARPGPYTHEGRFHAHSTSAPDPVTWHMVARHGVACRGPAPAGVDIWTDPRALAAWTLGNLDSYWRRLLDCASRLSSRWGLATLTPYTVVWVVTGVTRLHYALATGELTSKEGAGRYALAAFPEQWQRVVRESLRIRRADWARPGVAGAVGAQLQERLRLRAADDGGSLYPTPLARRREVLAFGDMVISDAHHRYCDPPADRSK
jgi:Domain of unknown function (DUF4111)/Nucleotidyltransferase domain